MDLNFAFEFMIKLSACELRVKEPTEEDLAKIVRHPIYLVLDNILDTYNVGAIFRLADAMAVGKVYLCGQTNVPTDPKVGHKIQKASVGTWRWVPWEHCASVADAISNVKANSNSTLHVTRYKLQVISIEQHPKSIPYDQADYSFPLAFIVGNETYGVSEEALQLSDAIVEIPMFGVNKSLNVMVSLAIVLWEAERVAGRDVIQ